jgi:drug/metabolite transporter (DMT)-like permease
VRFLFGFPFAILFLAGVMTVTGAPWPHPALSYVPWLLAGALFQIGATATMLAAMGQRSFVVTIAYIKTEPIQVAIFGLLFLGDALNPWLMTAIIVATTGVVVMSFKPGAMAGGIRPTIVGLVSGGMFALSAIGYRGAILNLQNPNFVVAATFTLTLGLILQAALLTGYLALRDRAVLAAIAKQWRPSLFAGFMGSAASEFWFLAFAIATAASVRTLALVEVLFAQAISSFLFHQKVSAREGVGIVLIVIGCVLLIWFK